MTYFDAFYDRKLKEAQDTSPKNARTNWSFVTATHNFP